MRNRLAKLASLAMAAVMSAGMLTGCGSASAVGTKTQDGGKTLFTYAGEDYTLKEAWLYGRITSIQYEEAYKDFVTESVWDLNAGEDPDGNVISMEDYVKMQTVAQMKQIHMLVNHAQDYDVELTEDEIKECEEYATTFCEDSTGKMIIEECGASKDDVIKMYTDNAIAAKVRDNIVEKADNRVSDEEARKTTILRVGFDTVITDENGNTTPMSEKDKKAAKAKAEKALSIIEKNEASIEQIAKEVGFENTVETFAAGESEEGEAFEALIAGAKDGDIIHGVFETPNGYVITKLVSYIDREATDENAKTIVSQRQQNLFFEAYSEWTEEYNKDWDYNTSIDQELWSQLRFGDVADAAADTTEE